MASAKMASAIDVRIDDVGSMLKFRISFPLGENSARFCRSLWLPGSILNFRIGSVSSIGGLIATTLFADIVSDSQKNPNFAQHVALQKPFANKMSQKPENHPNFEKNALGVKRRFSEQLSEFRGILGATLRMALTT